MYLKLSSVGFEVAKHGSWQAWVIGLVGTVGLLAGGCNKAAPSLTMNRPPPPVVVATATSRDVPIYIHEIGHCAPVESVTIIPQVAGQVMKVHFTERADLKKGDPLFTIDPRPYKAAVEQAAATLAKDRAAADNAASFAERQLKVFKQNSISAAEYDSARFASNAAVAAVSADQAMIDTAQINLDYCSIKSPIDGRAGQRLVDAGNVTKANEGAMLVVQRMDPIYFDFTTSEKNLPVIRDNMARGTLKARVGMPDASQSSSSLEVTYPAEASGIRDGKLTFLDNTVKDGAGTIKLRVELPNTDRFFWPGQFAHVWLVLDVKKDAVIMPAVATQTGQTGEFVFVIKLKNGVNTAEQRPIKIGQTQAGQMVVVNEGLKAGETVITDGQIAVTPDGPVKIVESQAGPTTAQTAGLSGDDKKGGDL